MKLLVSVVLAVLPLPAWTFSLRPRLDNGLAITPPMGWNSYNHYSCSPNESIIHSNAQALVDLGLSDLGYYYVTTDCGWSLPNRTDEGTLTWNPDLFPDGYPALGDFIHGLGLGFGVYGDGGIQTCMTGSPAQAGSLFHEQLDADTFADWGADLLKYDNCYSEVSTGYENVDYTPPDSPSGRYKNMSDAILATNRSILFQICDWGVDFPSLWAPSLGNTWRITNDIIPEYKTIPRILNQAVPQTSFAGPGQWLDLDMLEVGNNVFTTPEEQTHFSLWSIIKSPLVIGGALKDTYTSINSDSLAILMNQDIISYNQDSLGVAASWRRRWTEDGYDLWAGPLSDNRTIVAVINLLDEDRTLTLDLPTVGFQSAGNIKDIWNNATTADVLTSYSGDVAAHGTLLLELSDTTTTGIYGSQFLQTSGNSSTFSSIYGITSSANYTAVIEFASSSTEARTIQVSTSSSTFSTYTIAASASSATVTIALSASDDNILTVVSSIAPSSLTISDPTSNFYAGSAFDLAGDAVLDTCSTGTCLPAGTKVGYLSPTGSASILIAQRDDDLATSARYVEVMFTNNDIAFDTSWTTGTNTRNLTLTLNGVTTRIETPLSGRSSELFSPGLGWYDSSGFGVLLEGWESGTGYDNLTVSNIYGDEGVQSYGADFVGVYIWN